MRSFRGRLIGLLMAAVACVLPTVPRTPVTIKFSQHQFVKRGHAKILSGGDDSGSILMAIGRSAWNGLTALADLPLRLTGWGQLALQGGHVVVLKGEMAKKDADLKVLLKELDAGQKEMEAGPLSQTRGDELDKKAVEAETLQAELDRHARFGKLSRAVPADSPIPGKKTREQAKREDGRVITTPGHLFVMSDAYKNWLDQRQGMSGQVDVKSVRGGRVELKGEEAEAFEKKAFDAATLSDLGDDALIMPFNDQDLVRFAEPERRTLRSLIPTVPVTTDSVRYVKHTATARNAETQTTRGGLKKYLTVTFAPAVMPIETIAVLSKVTEQDIEDAPRLVAIVNDEMTLDVEVEEERQIAWGTGTGEISGIFDQAPTEFDRAVGGDTLIDTIRRIRTDLVLARVMPDGVAAHPLDWEEIELEKGSDSRYVWAVIQTVQGARIWSMPVVETAGMENPLTGEIRLVVADWKRGATLYDRHDVRLAVGFVDDDFARNLRTLRAEERLALAVKRAYAIEYTITQAAS